MRVEMFVASEEATSGSVMAKAERIWPSMSGWSHCDFCSAVPNMCSTSMLPVFGASQLIASGAMCDDQPVTSASAAYSTFVRPETSGRNRFHSPRERASAFSSSTTGGSVWSSGPFLRRYSSYSCLGGEHLGVHEVLQASQVVLGLGGVLEVHGKTFRSR